MGGMVLITGATSGFGKACAERFAEAGFGLALVGRRTDRLEALAAELGERVPCRAITLDVRDRVAVKKSLTALPEPFDAPDILVNNAGLALGLEPAQAAELDDWDIMVDTNVKGLMYCTRAILPAMVERGRGHVVNIGSIAGTWPYPGGNVYGATKAFVRQFSQNLRTDLAGTGVRVTDVAPGLSESEFSIVRFHGDEQRAAGVYQNTTPLYPKDIAEIVYWVSTLPPHVNVNSLDVMPTSQTWGPLAIHRKEPD